MRFRILLIGDELANTKWPNYQPNKSSLPLSIKAI